jgi:hypothetical protein
MEITLARALKEKNRIVGEINSLKKIFERENSRIENNTSTQVNREELWNKILDRTQKLIILKSKIAATNVNIYSLIEEMAELKTRIIFLQSLIKVEGTEEVNTFILEKYPNYKPKVYTAYFNVTKVDEEVSELQKKIAFIQDEIDEYNAKTKITI